MPTTFPTLLDIVKRNGSDDVVGLIDETSKAHPELDGFARSIKGLNYKTRVRISLPTVGFRNVNEGTPGTLGLIENRLIECYLMNPRWEADKAVADASEDGPEMYLADEAIAMMEAANQTLCTQFYYGTVNDQNKGFPGLRSALDDSMVVDATGTTEDTCSSLYAVRWGRQDVSWVWGLNAGLKMSDITEARVLDGASNPYTAYVQELENARPGLQVGSRFSIGRIKKLTEDNGKGLTDKLVAALLAKFPVGKPPHALYATRRSIRQLRDSRTATNATGAEAPFPTEVFGIPLHATDALTDVEKLAS